MSGRKQHFIPQSLLRGFGVQRGKSTYVVAYTHDRGIFSPATDGIAAERNFYSELLVEGEVETLDDRITAYEGPFASLLAKLRSLGDDETADSKEAAELVTHLAVRNDHFRKAIVEAGTAMMLHSAGVASDSDFMRRKFGVDGGAPSEFFDARLSEAFQEHRAMLSLAGLDEQAFKDWMFSELKANFDTMHKEIGPDFAMFLATLVGEVPAIAANSQRKSLNETMAPELRVERMGAFAWRVVHPEEPSILPDCVTVGFGKDGIPAPLMLLDLDELETVYLPLSYDRVLVGSRESASALPADLNAVFAGCSWDFFVARDRNISLEALKDGLRSLASAFLDDLVESAVASAVDEDAGRQ